MIYLNTLFCLHLIWTWFLYLFIYKIFFQLTKIKEFVVTTAHNSNKTVNTLSVNKESGESIWDNHQLHHTMCNVLCKSLFLNIQAHFG